MTIHVELQISVTMQKGMRMRGDSRLTAPVVEVAASAVCVFMLDTAPGLVRMQDRNAPPVRLPEGGDFARGAHAQRAIQAVKVRLHPKHPFDPSSACVVPPGRLFRYTEKGQG